MTADIIGNTPLSADSEPLLVLRVKQTPAVSVVDWKILTATKMTWSLSSNTQAQTPTWV